MGKQPGARHTAGLYGEPAAQQIRISYGGSANVKNIGALMTMPDIGGALIGGASLKVDSFINIVRITSEQYTELRAVYSVQLQPRA